MTSARPAPRTIRRTRIRWGRVAALLAVLVAVAAALGQQLPASPSPSSTSTSTARSADVPVVVADALPGTAGLDPALRGALRRAAADAARDGVVLVVDSGRRSPEHQARLLREAVAKYGSEEEAARWVATPTTSAHVSGDAVDIGPSAGAAWLSAHGPAYGLCRIYGNEPWHFELRPEAAGGGCPPMYADPTHDPRMQR